MRTLFEGIDGPGKFARSLDDIDASSTYLTHTECYTVVSVSRMTISSFSWKSGSVSRREEVASIIIGGKFWKAGMDTIHNYFSVYDLEFDPSQPQAERFHLRHFPCPQPYPHEKEEPHFYLAFAAPAPSFTRAKRGVLTHTVAHSHLQMQFHVSVIGLDNEGNLYFARVNKDFCDYLHGNRIKIRAFVEEYSGALCFMSADARMVNIWYPI